MDYNDQFVLNQIKRLQERLSYVEARVGFLSVAVATGNMILQDAPPAPAAPADPNLPCLVVFRDGSQSLVWDPVAHAWI